MITPWMFILVRWNKICLMVMRIAVALCCTGYVKYPWRMTCPCLSFDCPVAPHHLPKRCSNVSACCWHRPQMGSQLLILWWNSCFTGSECFMIFHTKITLKAIFIFHKTLQKCWIMLCGCAYLVGLVDLVIDIPSSQQNPWGFEFFILFALRTCTLLH